MIKKINILIGFVLVIFVSSCTSNPATVTNSEDYNAYLKLNTNTSYTAAQNEHDFWNQKLETNANQHPYLLKLANAQTELFASSGKIEHLIAAENYLRKVNKQTNETNATYLRSLAHNLISQHRFQEALSILQQAEKNGEKLKATQKMLFDVHLELVNDASAEAYLTTIKNLSDFDYLIRLAKWSDHQGNLTNAITYFELAKRVAESSKNKSQLQWIYSNLGDVYGHANRIKDSYDHYLKALVLNPDDAYSKKGIAWIVYSHERNPKEALRILNAVTQQDQSPDYFLLQSEIAEYVNDIAAKDKYLEKYRESVSDQNYGVMYNRYNALLAAEEFKNADKALEIAKQEIEQRPTPHSYDLLAWSYHANKDHKKALEIIETHVAGKTFEPEVQYHMAEIYKANGMGKAAMKLKKELLESAYELGPVLTAKMQLL